MSTCQTSEEVKTEFEPKKIDSLKLSDIYYRLSLQDNDKSLFFYKRYETVRDCGSYLEFKTPIDFDGVLGKSKLHSANFCKDRLCPMCSWRRSYKIFSQVSTLMQHIDTTKYAFLFLTLTAPNCQYEDLEYNLDKFFKGFRRLSQMPRFKKSVKGWVKALEIRANLKTSTFHPHLHCILVVNKSYFTDKRLYISQAEWLYMWRLAMDDWSITQVDIRKAKDKEGRSDSEKLKSVVAEIAKYTVKGSDILSDPDQSDTLVRILSTVLKGRRLISFDQSGVFGRARSELALDDIENGDLINIEDSVISPALAYLITRYNWSAGVYSMNFVDYERCVSVES